MQRLLAAHRSGAVRRLLLNLEVRELVVASLVRLRLCRRLLKIGEPSTLDQLVQAGTEIDEVLRYLLLLIPQLVLFEIQVLSLG